MNSTELKEKVYKAQAQNFSPPLTKEDVSKLLDTTFGILKKELENNKKVVIRSFGTFKPIIRKGREYIISGKKIKKEDQSTIVFKPSKNLKEVLQNKKVDNEY